MTNIKIAILTVVALAACSCASAQDNQTAAVMSGNVRHDDTPGEQALKLGDYTSAESIFKQNLSSARDPEAKATAMTGVGEALLGQGSFSEAASILGKALSIAQKLPSGDALVARILDDMGWSYQASGKMDKAEDVSRQALLLRQKYLKPDSDELADSLGHMGYLNETQKDWPDALNYYTQANEILKAKSGASTINYANILERIGSMKLKLGKAQEAQADFLESLRIRDAAAPAVRPYSPHLAADTAVFHFVPGAPNCISSFANGLTVETIRANGLSVQASIQTKPNAFLKTTRATITVINSNNQPVQLLPQPPQFIVLSPKVILCDVMDAEQLAQTVEKKGQRKAGWIRFWGENATATSTTTMIGNQPYFPYGYGWGNSRYGNSWYNRGSNMTTMTTSVPDFEARARAMEKAKQVTQQSATDASNLRQNALGPTTIPPGGTISGTLDFDETKFDRAVMQIPIGNAVFEFKFDRTGGN